MISHTLVASPDYLEIFVETFITVRTSLPALLVKISSQLKEKETKLSRKFRNDQIRPKFISYIIYIYVLVSCDLNLACNKEIWEGDFFFLGAFCQDCFNIRDSQHIFHPEHRKGKNVEIAIYVRLLGMLACGNEI